MTSRIKQPNKRSPRRPLNLWFERGMAILALCNLGFVIFDLSYTRLRNFWLQGNIVIPVVKTEIPVPILSTHRDTSPVTRWYDPIKGIEPNRDTVNYLQRVDQLNEQILRTGVRSPKSEEILADLRRLSSEMIDTNPFAIANKTGTLERIKNEMRLLIFGNRNESSKTAFDLFWSSQYLETAPIDQGLSFFNTNIRPLIESNYYRTIDETGEFTSNFWQIDLWFTLIFAMDFLARTFYLSRQYKTINWLDAMIWRSYDILLFLPFWRWLRVIPVVIRCHQAELIDLERIRTQLSRGIITNVAEELTEVIILNAVTQFQEAVESGDLLRQAFKNTSRRYIDLNNINEIEAITTRLVQVLAYQVLPVIQPDLEALLRHQISRALSQAPAYQTLKGLPGVEAIATQTTEQLIHQLSSLLIETSQSLYTALSVDDPEGDQLFNNLVEKFTATMGSGLQQQQTLSEIQSLLTDFLEEVKLNYVQRLGDEDIERLIEESRKKHPTPYRSNLPLPPSPEGKQIS